MRLMVSLVATIPLCLVCIASAQAAGKQAGKDKLLAVGAPALGSSDMRQERGGQLGELLFNMGPLLELTQAYRTHHNIVVSPAATADSNTSSSFQTIAL